MGRVLSPQQLVLISAALAGAISPIQSASASTFCKSVSLIAGVVTTKCYDTLTGRVVSSTPAKQAKATTPAPKTRARTPKPEKKSASTDTQATLSGPFDLASCVPGVMGDDCRKNIVANQEALSSNLLSGQHPDGLSTDRALTNTAPKVPAAGGRQAAMGSQATAKNFFDFKPQDDNSKPQGTLTELDPNLNSALIDKVQLPNAYKIYTDNNQNLYFAKPGADGAVQPSTATPITLNGEAANREKVANLIATKQDATCAWCGNASPNSAGQNPGGGSTAPPPPTADLNDAWKQRDLERDSKADIEKAQAIAKEKLQVEEDVGGLNYAKANSQSKDRCKISATLGKGAGNEKDYQCDSTESMVEVTQVGTALAEVGGNVATQIQGAQSTMQAQQSGSQSGALNAAADLQGSTAKTQMMLGAIGAAAGAYELYLANKHSKNQKKFQDELGNGTKLNPNLANNETIQKNGTIETGQNKNDHGYFSSNTEFGKVIMSDNGAFGDMNSMQNRGGSHVDLTSVINVEKTLQEQGFTDKPGYAAAKSQLVKVQQQQYQARMEQIKNKGKAIQGEVKKIGNEAAEEQRKMAEEAKKAGMITLIKGGQQLTNGYMNNMAANQLKAAAHDLSTLPTGAAFQPASSSALAGGDALAPRLSSAIGGSGAPAGASGAAAEDPKAEDGSTLGTGTNTAPPSTGLSGPAPAPAQFRNQASSEGKNGAGGAVSTGSTSNSNGPSTEDSPRLADNRGGISYEGGGSYSAGGGGGMGGGDKGPDLSGLLAQFLPKKDEEAGNKNGILDFGGRAPATVEENISLLDRGTNIFDRIHHTYQEKQRRNAL